MKKIIKNGIIILPDSIVDGDIFIDGDKISGIGKNLDYSSDTKIFDADKCYILPGGIDAHTHFDLSIGKIKSSDDFESGSKAGIYGGTTTIIDYAHQSHGNSLQNGLEESFNKASNKCYTDYSFHLGIVDYNNETKSELTKLADLGITSVKCYTTYDKLKLSYDKIEDIIGDCRNEGILCNIHCEDDQIIERDTNHLIKSGRVLPNFHPLARPHVAESKVICKVLEIAKRVSCPIYIVHVSTREGIEKISEYKKSGAKIFCETCPHYLILNDERYELPDFESVKYVMTPPLRDKEDNLALWNHLNQSIDVLATDHCSFNFKGQKDLGINDFTKIPNGIGSIEHRISLIYTYGVLENKIDLIRMVQLISENPARIFGLYPQKGLLAVGSDADILVFDPKKDYTISVNTHHQHMDYNPYEGMKVWGKPKYVFLRGELALDGDNFVGIRGKFVKRRRTE